FVARAGIEHHTTIVSTTATHDCSQYNTETNEWYYLQSPPRLQIPHPELIRRPFLLPGLQTIAITHKLRVIIEFDKNLSNEKSLQLSFPISIHPTLEPQGAPVHPDLVAYAVRPHRHRRGRLNRVGALYINHEDFMNNGGLGHGPTDEDDDDIIPLPIYDDREENLLLMVGEEVQELDHLDQEELNALGLSMGMIYGTPEPDASFHSPVFTDSVAASASADQQL
ncbi:hypothetical protein BGZ94_007686, partial [Podila epigama]